MRTSCQMYINGKQRYESVVCELQIYATHGVRGFFKGLSAPLVTVAAFNAVLFAAKGSMERLLAHTDGDVCNLIMHHDCSSTQIEDILPAASGAMDGGYRLMPLFTCPQARH